MERKNKIANKRILTYTPGPWIFGKTDEGKRLILGGQDRRYIASITIYQIPRRMGLYEEPERKANARLIAAAPELLECLKEIKGTATLATGELLEKCEQAIAKAEGKA